MDDDQFRRRLRDKLWSADAAWGLAARRPQLRGPIAIAHDATESDRVHLWGQLEAVYFSLQSPPSASLGRRAVALPQEAGPDALQDVLKPFGP